MAKLPKRIKLRASTNIIQEYNDAKLEGTKESPIRLSLSPLFVMKDDKKEILVDEDGAEIAALLSVTDKSPELDTLKLSLVQKEKDGRVFTFYIAGSSVGECEVIAI